MASSPQQQLGEPSDEEMRKLLVPNPSPEQVLGILKESYGTPQSEVKIVKELDSYDDKNFMVNLDGTTYLFKVHNGVESRDFVQQKGCSGETTVISLQNTMMQHCNTHSISTSKPQLSCTTKEPLAIHSLPVVSPKHSPQDLVVRLLSWVPGRTMSSLKVLPLECLADSGRFLAKLDLALDQLDASKLQPAAGRHHAWDGKNTVDLRPFVKCISNLERRSIVTSVLDTFQTRLLDSGLASKFRTGLAQGDFNDANILIDDNFCVSGVIDFGDSLESWRVLDISVAMAYAMVSAYGKTGRGISAAAALLRGFASAYPLQPLEMEHLHLLIACRLACSATLGAYSIQQNPDNEYLSLHAEPAWKMLELIWDKDAVRRQAMSSALTEVFTRACSSCTVKKGGVIDCTDLSFPDPQFCDPLSSLREQDKTAANGPPPAKVQKTSS